MTGWRPAARAAALSAQQAARRSRIEDYLFIGGQSMSVAQAAARVGVSECTICRYQAALRRQAAR